MTTLLEGLKQLGKLVDDPIVQALGNLPWNGGKSINLVFFQNKITEEQMRTIKRCCGPLEFREDGDNKDARGNTQVGQDLETKLSVTVYDAMSCTPMDISKEDGPTIEQMAVIMNKIHSGELKVVNCAQAGFAQVCATPGCENASDRGTQCQNCIEEQKALEETF